MAQPIRKVIQEKYPTEEKPIYTLLVDGNNLLTISMSDAKRNSDGVHYGGIFQFFLQLKLMLKKKQYDYIYVCFDDDESGILRYQYYPLYKLNRDKHYGDYTDDLSDYMKKYNQTLRNMENYIYNKNKPKKVSDTQKFINENFARERDIILDMCEELCIRTIFNKKTEGDDIIAYYVLHKLPNEKIVIMTTDNDLMQLITDDVCVYSKQMNIYLSPDRFKKAKGYPVENILIKKILLGDSSDNIGNIYGLSETKLKELIPEFSDRKITISEVKEKAKELIDERVANKKKPYAWCENIINGKSNKEYNGDFYEINEKIIDLHHPLLTDDAIQDIEILIHKPIDTTDRTFGNLYNIVKEEKMEELCDTNNFSSFFYEFQELMTKEQKRYVESQK